MTQTKETQEIKEILLSEDDVNVTLIFLDEFSEKKSRSMPSIGIHLSTQLKKVGF